MTDTQVGILEAAQEVFARRGFRGADVAAIARRAGVGKGMVYRLFGPKERLFRAVVRWGNGMLLEELRGTLGGEGDPVRQMEAYVDTYLAFYGHRHRFLTVALRAREEMPREMARHFLESQRKFSAFTEEIVRAGIARGLIKDLDPHLLASALQAGLEALLHLWIHNREAGSLSRWTPIAREVLFHGMLTERGRRRGP